MTSILSAISEHFSKSLILGTFLPVVLYVVLNLILVIPLLPADVALPRTLEALDTQWKVLVVTLATLLLTALLYNLNVPLIRLYEGYLWEHSWIGEKRAGRYRERLAAAQARWKGMRTLLRALPASDPRYQTISKCWNETGRNINRHFPLDSAALPTRLGNIIRSFEDYPRRQYGISSIPLWPRLIAKIDKDYATATDDAKTAVDFMLNCSALCALLAASILFGGLLYPSSLGSSRWALWGCEVAAFFVLSYLAYRGAIDAASAWGDMVKGSFDLYRWELLKQLGFTEMPGTMEDERKLWKNISQQMIFGDTPTVPLAVYAAAKEKAEAVEVKTARGVSPPEADGSVLVTLQVKNVDAGKREAANVVVTDTLPKGWYYVWESARAAADSKPIPVSGLNPYHFEVGSLGHGEGVTFTYRALPLKS